MHGLLNLLHQNKLFIPIFYEFCEALMYVYRSCFFFSGKVYSICTTEGIHYPDDSEMFRKKWSSLNLTSIDNSLKQLISTCENGCL